jgi:hypothetical protein
LVIYHRDRIPDRPDSDTAVQADGLVGMPDGCIVKERKCSANRYEAFPCQHASNFLERDWDSGRLYVYL